MRSYYELAKPLAERNPEGEGYRSLYKSQAMLLAIEGNRVKLVSLSINGSPPRKEGIVLLGVPPAEDATTPLLGHGSMIQPTALLGMEGV